MCSHECFLYPLGDTESACTYFNESFYPREIENNFTMLPNYKMDFWRIGYNKYLFYMKIYLYSAFVIIIILFFKNFYMNSVKSKINRDKKIYVYLLYMYTYIFTGLDNMSCTWRKTRSFPCAYTYMKNPGRRVTWIL